MPYFKTVIVAGKTIEVYKGYTRKLGDHRPRSGRKKPTAEEMEKVNQKNAEARLRRLINANFGYGDFHLVLTYRPELRPEPASAKNNIIKFIRKLRAEYKKLGEDLKYIHVTEYKTTAIHHHLIINDVDNKNISKLVRKLWEYGNPKFTSLDGTGQYKRLAEYLIKETSKTFKSHEGGHMQRYSCSRNLKKPVSKTTVIKNAKRWSQTPKAKKGYYIDKETVENGISLWTGRPFQRYTMIKLNYSSRHG